jgi:hypothetical protein
MSVYKNIFNKILNTRKHRDFNFFLQLYLHKKIEPFAQLHKIF